MPNVRLGMAPRDVRERFAPGGEGTWRTGVGSGDDTVLEWTATGAPGDRPARMLDARFEFHLGMLVAIRARTTEPPSSERVSLTPKTVTVLAPGAPGGTQITVLARDCPTHKDEADTFAARAH